MQIAAWMTKTFSVSAELINSFDALSRGIEIDAKTKTKSSQEYKVRKKTKARTISLDVNLHAMAGVSVEAEIYDWETLAHQGKGGKFYVGGRSIGPCNYILTSVKTTETKYTVRGQMIYAKIALSFEQSSKNYKIPRPSTLSNAFNVLREAKISSRSLKSI